ncbi:MAG: 3-oxoadipate enol-lactonase [Pseudomonadota bacterium]|nr:3-oxoadipate enol-lactonase [Pseudomonadota bacterium]
MATSFIELAGTRLHYRVDGDPAAPALVLSNSLGTDLTMWDRQMQEFARAHRVVRYDTRGHGLSSVSAGPYTVEQLGRDALGLMDALGIERAHFCGLSLGGMIGQWLAANEGYRIDRLVLANTSARIPGADAYNTRIDKVRAGGMAAVTPAIIERWFTAPFMAQSRAQVDLTRAMLERCPAEGYVAACAAVRDMDQRADLVRITRPTLVITGTHDLATPPSEGRLLADHIAGARYVELPASHLSNVEAAPLFTRAVLDFLG